MKKVASLLAGEKPLENAPPIQLGNGETCIPQHFLLFEHTRESVEKIVVNIDYSDKYLVFVCEDYTGIYIQIGIVGFDNFVPIKQQSEQKVVYGRKWRVEPQLPTSEIIQTVFLAIKTAREHEVRELFQLNINGRTTTPFNNHHDLPLMAQNSELVSAKRKPTDKNFSPAETQQNLNQITYDSSKFKLNSAKPFNGKWIVEIKIINGINSQLHEIKNFKITFLLNSLSVDELYFQLMDSLIALSNQHVEENFCYLNFARFSRKNSVREIAKLSSTLRKETNELEKNGFINTYKKANYETDKTRVPALYAGPLSEKIRSSLERYGELQGIMPFQLR